MRRIRNMVNIVVKNSRADFIKDQLETHKNDPKKFWKNISKIIPNKNSNAQQNFNNIHDNNNDRIKQEYLADHINLYFSNIGLKLYKEIPETPDYEPTLPNPQILTSIEVFQTITEEKLTEINKISIYKSSGLKNMPSYLLKSCFRILITQLLVIMNKSLFNGYFPLMWRKAIIVPIPKVNIPTKIGKI